MNKDLVLANCIDTVRSGHSTIEECLQQYPALRDELRPLLETALQIRTDGGPLSAESRARIRARLLAAMHDPNGVGQRAPPRQAPRPFFAFRLAPALGAGLLALAVAGGGTVFAAQRSLPGDALYRVKTASENVQLALTFDHHDKADLRLRLAGRRVNEIASQANRGDAPLTSSAERVAEQLDRALRGLDNSQEKETRDFLRRLSEASIHDQITLDSLAASSSPANKPSLQKVIDVLRRGQLIADVSYENPSFLDSSPSVTDADLEDGQFKIDGTIGSTDGETWKIDGLTLDHVSYAGNSPSANSRVRTEGLTRNGKTYITKVEGDEDNTAEVTIKGKFKGSTDGGAVWNVGGIAVTVEQGTSEPSQGDELHMRRPPESDKAGFSQVEARHPVEAGVDFDGKLAAVDANVRTITVVRAGTQIKVNTAGAIIRTENKRPVTFSQLQSSVGKDMSIKGLSRKGGVLYAVELIVDGGER